MAGRGTGVGGRSCSPWPYEGDSLHPWRFLPNLQNRRLWVESENLWVSLRVSNAGLRTIDKKGIDVILAELRAKGTL